MALGKYSRMDGRRSATNYCSTAILVVFVAFCLVGVWMMTSSSVVPVENVDTSTEENKDVVTEKFTENIDTKPKQFEDNPGELPKDAIEGDTNANRNEKGSDSKKSITDSDIPNETITEQDGEKKPITDTSKPDEGKDRNDTDGGETAKVGGEQDEEKEGTKPESSANKESDNESDKEVNSDQKKAERASDENKEVVEKKEAKKEAVGQPLSSGAAQYDLLDERTVQNSSSWSTQAKESQNEKEAQQKPSSQPKPNTVHSWKLCNVTAKQDYIPCLDNLAAIKHLRSTKHYEHRERHCPDVSPTCLVPLPEVYKRPISWPQSRDKIWYFNVPHTKLAQVKGHQNWVKVTGEYLTFPGGGTQFKHGALHYIEFIESIVPDIAWGKRSRVVLDVGCGVASFGGFLFEKNVLTMSFAPKDEHEAQVQFALERGIPAISAVMGTTRLPFPARVFDVVHCARCRVPWHIEGGKLLLELNRVLRPGGYFVWSATPVYQKLDEDVLIWNAMSNLTKAMCWELVKKGKDSVNSVGVAIYRKPVSNSCYGKRMLKEPPLCKESDDADAAWNVPLQACMHKVPEESTTTRGGKWPEEWPERLKEPPSWLLSSQVGVYGKPAPEDFTSDYDHWDQVVSKSYLNEMDIDWSSVRNVLDMRSVYGGFAAALRGQNVWVMSVVPIDSPDTLPLIYERGLFGIYHDWCESFSTYPRSYDLLHADHILSKLKNRCNLVGVVAEMDRILRPEGKLIVRDDVQTLGEVEGLVKSMKWEVRLTYSKNREGLLSVQKTFWRPAESEELPYAIGG